jgi:hypothetical protein
MRSERNGRGQPSGSVDAKKRAGKERARKAAEARRDPSADWISRSPSDVALAAQSAGRKNAVMTLLERTLGQSRAAKVFGYTIDSTDSVVAAQHMRARLTQRATAAGNWERWMERLMREDWRIWTHRQAKRILDIQSAEGVSVMQAAEIAAKQVIEWWEIGGVLPRRALRLEKLKRALYYATREDRRVIEAAPVSAFERVRRMRPHLRDEATLDGIHKAARLASQNIRPTR